MPSALIENPSARGMRARVAPGRPGGNAGAANCGTRPRAGHATAAPMSAESDAYDVILAGGGLAASLIALRLKATRPGVRVLMLEREDRIGGEHTWCHFASDVSPAIGAWLRPLVVQEWAGYDIRFPEHARTLTTPYRAITSARLHEVVCGEMGGA